MFTLPKSAKLLRTAQYDRVYQQGRKITGHFIVLHFSLGTSSQPRLGITVTKKFGKSHDRNRFKRLVREVFRLHRSTFPQQIDMNVRPRFYGSCPTFAALETDLMQLIQSLSKAQIVHG